MGEETELEWPNLLDARFAKLALTFTTVKDKMRNAFNQ